MQFLSQLDCQKWISANVPAGIHYPYRISYRLPADAGKKTALARAVTRLCDAPDAGLFMITGWGIFPSSENMGVFEGYRKSLGELRSLKVAPGHVFLSDELPELECLVDIALYFYWDADLFDGSRRLWFRFSHDECVDIRVSIEELLPIVRESLRTLNVSAIQGHSDSRT